MTASETAPERRPRRGRRWLLGTYAVVITLVAAGTSVGWYAEHQWNPNVAFDGRCTVEADLKLTIDVSHSPGDIVGVRVTSEPDRVVVAARAEHSWEGDRAGLGWGSTYSTLLPSPLDGRPIVDPQGHRLGCRVIDPTHAVPDPA